MASEKPDNSEEKQKGFTFNDDSTKPKIYRTNHILGIGIDNYVYCPKLNNAVKDVKDFIELMTTSFDFREENINVLFNADATRDNILQTLDKYATTLTDKDNLIIYFSGHGEYKKTQENGYWIPVDAEQKHSQYISNSDIKDHLNVIKAHHIFLISDACFSGSLFRNTQGKNVSEYIDKYASRWGLTSGRGIVSDGKAGTNSPFANELLKHLKRTASDKKEIGVQALCTAVTETVAPNGEQLPTGQPLMITGHDLGQFVFTPKGTVPQRIKDNSISNTNGNTSFRGNSKKTKWTFSKNKKIILGVGIVVIMAFVLNYFINQKQSTKEKPISITEFIEPKMISVKGATYQMGSLDGEADETVKTIMLQDFAIGETEVTNREYLAFLNDRGNQSYIDIPQSAIKVLENNQFGAYKEDLDRPVVAVTYRGAEHYTKWLSTKIGKKYGLPTEAQWEYAAAGTNPEKTVYAGGNDTFKNIMWFKNNSGDSLHTVRTTQANVLGIYDMSGNVAEWCADSLTETTKPIRGGSYEDAEKNCRITNRNEHKTSGSSYVLGFRVIKE